MLPISKNQKHGGEKDLKKLIMVSMIAFLLLANGLTTFAQTTPNTQNTENCGCGEVTDAPEGITELEKKDVNKVVGQLHSNKDFREASKWLKSSGVKVDTKNAIGLHMEELKFNSGETFNDVKHIAINAPSSDGKDRGILVAIIDNQTNELLHLKADLFFNLSEDGFAAIQSYTTEDGLGDKVTQEELASEKEGEFTTFFSPCVHVSVWLCIYHCGLWAVAHPAAGVACGALCAYAFAYAC